MTERTISAYMSAHGMLPLPPGGRVLCACSGGADSTALLHLLHGMDGVEVVCAHFNHHLRGAESDRDEAFVRALCQSLGVTVCVDGADVAAYAAEKRLGVETAARELRYAFLSRCAAEHGCCRIATAHNADDNAETMLLHLLRGAGERGLCGIPPVRGNIIRPLLGTDRAEIEAYLAAHDLPHMEDSSNAADICARNRIRHAVMPVLCALNPAAVKNVCAAAELLAEDERYLSGLASAFLTENLRGGALSVAALRTLPKPVAMRALRDFCGGAPGRTHLEAVWALCYAAVPRGESVLPGGVRAVREQDRLTILHGAEPPTEPMPPRLLRVGETVALPEIGRSVRCAETEDYAEIHKTFNIFCFKSAEVCGNIYVASRREGDRIRLAGRGCTKAVRRLFSEVGLPLRTRVEIPVFSDDAGVIAVAGFGVAERCAPEKGKKAIIIEIL